MTVVYPGSVPDQSNPADYIKIFVNEKKHLMQFLESQIKVLQKNYVQDGEFWLKDNNYS